MAFETGKVRAFVTDLLKKNKALTEKEVKAAIGKAFKLNPREVGAGVIREVREALGHRPARRPRLRAEDADAGPDARGEEGHRGDRREVRHPARPAGRLPPPPAEERSGAGRGRPPKARGAGRAVRRRPPRRGPGRPRKAAAGPARRQPAGSRPRRVRPLGAEKRSSRISVTYQGTGIPEALAAFFRSLAVARRTSGLAGDRRDAR